MYNKNIQIKNNYFLSTGITPKALEIRVPKQLETYIPKLLETYVPRLLETESVFIEEVFEFIMEPERTENVKTVDSDPEFARWSDGQDLFM